MPAYHEWTAMMMVCIKLLLLIEQTLSFYGKHDVHNIPIHFKLDLIKFFQNSRQFEFHCSACFYPESSDTLIILFIIILKVAIHRFPY